MIEFPIPLRPGVQDRRRSSSRCDRPGYRDVSSTSVPGPDSYQGAVRMTNTRALWSKIASHALTDAFSMRRSPPDDSPVTGASEWHGAWSRRRRRRRRGRQAEASHTQRGSASVSGTRGCARTDTGNWPSGPGPGRAPPAFPSTPRRGRRPVPGSVRRCRCGARRRPEEHSGGPRWRHPVVIAGILVRLIPDPVAGVRLHHRWRARSSGWRAARVPRRGFARRRACRRRGRGMMRSRRKASLSPARGTRGPG